MYYLIIWDKERASIGQEGCLSKLEIPIDLAKYFFQLDGGEFPILSQLSFDDYDLFSGAQLEALVDELQRLSVPSHLAADDIHPMVKVVLDAKSLGKSILFDPFRRE